MTSHLAAMYYLVFDNLALLHCGLNQGYLWRLVGFWVLPHVLPKEDFSEPRFSSHEGELVSRYVCRYISQTISSICTGKSLSCFLRTWILYIHNRFLCSAKAKRVLLPSSLEVQSRSLVCIAPHSLWLPADCLVHSTWHLAFSLLWVLCDAPWP